MGARYITMCQNHSPRPVTRSPRTLILPTLSLVRSARPAFTPLKGGEAEHWRSFGCSF